MHTPRTTLTTLTFCVACLASLMMIHLPALAETCVPVEVQNIRPDQGSLMVAAYVSAEDFQKKPAISLQLRAGAATAKFSVCLPDGTAAATAVSLTLYQDLNDNGKLDANLLGIPSEPWGASGTTSSFSAPTWAATQVALPVTGGSPIVVKLSK